MLSSLILGLIKTLFSLLSLKLYMNMNADEIDKQEILNTLKRKLSSKEK